MAPLIASRQIRKTAARILKTKALCLILDFLNKETPIQILAALLLQADPERPDLTLNYIIIVDLLVIAAILSVIVVRRRMRERDDDWDR